MRKLVSIQKVLDVKPIPNADAIEVATVLGWEVVIKKDEIKAGDIVAYFEIDSFLPIQPEFEFLRKTSYRKLSNDSEGFALRTLELRKQISQGLIIPLHSLGINLPDTSIGTDITSLVGVTKYEKPIAACLIGEAKGTYPSFISKTDQDRIQGSVWSEFKDKYKDVEFEVTIKLEGTSATYYYRDGELGMCTRNLDLILTEEDLQITDFSNKKAKEANNTYLFAGLRANIFEGLKKLKRNIAIQGELIGPGVEGNIEKLLEHHVYVFDVFDIDKHKYLTREERLQILDEMGVTNHVPLHSITTLEPFKDIKDLLEFSKGKSLFAEKREGLVFKSTNLVDNKVISFKVVDNNYLLAQKD